MRTVNDECVAFFFQTIMFNTLPAGRLRVSNSDLAEFVSADCGNVRGVDAFVNIDGVTVSLHFDFVHYLCLVINILSISRGHDIAGRVIITKAIGRHKIIATRPQSKFKAETHGAIAVSVTGTRGEAGFRR